jgi:hypothetical protein
MAAKTARKETTARVPDAVALLKADHCQVEEWADDYFDSKVRVLAEMIKHHVREEEQKDGMFAEAKKSKKLDLQALGQRMLERKQALIQGGNA